MLLRRLWKRQDCSWRKQGHLDGNVAARAKDLQAEHVHPAGIHVNRGASSRDSAAHSAKRFLHSWQSLALSVDTDLLSDAGLTQKAV